MNFLNLEYFLTIAEEGSFSAAARRLYVSQQSLSELVKKLEDEIGAPLFKRGKTVTLTVAGEVFAEGGREILRAREKMFRDIAVVTDKRRRKLTIGISTFEVPPFLPGVLIKYTSEYPEYETTVEKRQVADISHSMLGIDFFVSYTPLDKNLEHIKILDDDYYVIVASKKLLKNIYGDRFPDLEQQLLETEDISLLQELPFIMLYDRWGNRAKYLDMIFSATEFSPIEGFKSDNGDLNASMCIKGIAAYIGSEDNCRRRFQPYLETGDNSLSMYKIKTPGVESVVALSIEKGKKLHHAEKTFIDTARKYLAENPY